MSKKSKNLKKSGKTGRKVEGVLDAGSLVRLRTYTAMNLARQVARLKGHEDGTPEFFEACADAVDDAEGKAVDNLLAELPCTLPGGAVAAAAAVEDTVAGWAASHSLFEGFTDCAKLARFCETVDE